MENQIRKTGFVPEPIEENQFKLGSLGDVVIKVDGNWKDFLPVFESQLEKNFDSSGCTAYGTLNAIETLEKFLTQKEQNYSDRFVYNGVGITPPGSDPHLVAEFIRKNGLVFEEDLPDTTDSLAEFLTPRPLTPDLIIKAGKWTWTLSHQWIITPSTPKEQKVSILKAELLKGTVAASVTAWYQNAQGLYYSPPELPNEHWTHVYNVDDAIHVNDSYLNNGTYLKALTLDHDIQYAKRYNLTRKLTVEQTSYFQKMINWILEQLGIIQKKVNELPKEPLQTPAIEEKPVITEIPVKPKYLWDTLGNIRHSIRLIADEYNMTVLQKDLLCDICACESGYDIHAKLVNSPKSIDRGLWQWNTLYHPETTDDVAYDPEKSTRLACKAILNKQAHRFWSASEPCWNKNHLYDKII